MVELSANLFKDEWRIRYPLSVSWARSEYQLKRNRLLSLFISWLFIYASQKAELIKMLYGQIGTFEDSGESWTIIFCKQQNRVEHRFYIIEDISTIFLHVIFLTHASGLPDILPNREYHYVDHLYICHFSACWNSSKYLSFFQLSRLTCFLLQGNRVAVFL